MGRTPFDAKWFSHKFKGTALRYEMCITMDAGDSDGPFRPGSYTDVKELRNGMKNHLMDGEYVIGDKGYTDQRCKMPCSIAVDSTTHKLARCATRRLTKN